MSRPSAPLLASVALLSGSALGLEILLMRLLSIAWWHHFAYMVISLALLGYGASGTLLTLARGRLLPRFRPAYAAAAALFGLAAPASFALAQRVPYSPLEVAWNPAELLGLSAVYLVLSVPFLCAGTAVGLALARFSGSPSGGVVPRLRKTVMHRGRRGAAPARRATEAYPKVCRRERNDAGVDAAAPECERIPETGYIGRVYAADLLGAGAGAAGVIGLLFLLPPAEALVAVGAAGPAAAALALLDRGPEGGSRRRWAAAGALAAAGAILVLAFPRAWVEPAVSQFKGLPGALRVPGVEVVAERSSPLGLLTVVESRQVPLRHAPGLSLASKEAPPEQLGVFTDADALTVIDRLPEPDPAQAEGANAWPDLGAVAYRDDLSSALPYHVLAAWSGAGEGPAVLVLGAGGGGEVASALAHGASRVDAVELDPGMLELVGERFAAFAGRLYQRPGVSVHRGEARGFAAASERRWDLVQVALLDSFTASAAGTHALSESHLYTVEALSAFLDRLEPGGFLALTRWLEVPPRGSLKLFATAVRALEERGVERPGERLLLLRSWKTATLLVKNGPFTPEELAAARAFAEERWFDLAWAPGMAREEANRFNVWEEPYLHDGARAVLAGGAERRRFLERYKFHVEPATDDRPYFFRFFKWGTLPELLALRGRGGTHLLEWGYPVLVATLAQALLAGLVLIVAPLAVLRRGRGRGRGAGERRPGLGRVAVYFLCLGLGFLFVEIAFIQRFTLFLAHPLYAVAVVLAAFLVFAGAGSAAAGRLAGWLERRLARRRGWDGGGAGRGGVPAIAAAAGAVVVLSVAYTVALPPLFAHAMALPQAAKLAVALTLLAPLAFVMGMPFPLGLELTARREPAWVPWAWAVNGCASVVSAVAATLAAVHLGFTAVVLAAAVLYALAAGAIRRV